MKTANVEHVWGEHGLHAGLGQGKHSIQAFIRIQWTPNLMIVATGCKTVPRDGAVCRKVKWANEEISAPGAEITPEAGHRGASIPRKEYITISNRTVLQGCALLAEVEKPRLWAEPGEGDAMGTAHSTLGSTSNCTAAFPSTGELIHPGVPALCQQGFPQGSCGSGLAKPEGFWMPVPPGQLLREMFPESLLQLPEVFHTRACIRARLP